MLQRFRGAMRDLWWLLIPFLGGAIAMWVLGWPSIAITLIVILIALFVFFAIARYDDSGHERADRE